MNWTYTQDMEEAVLNEIKKNGIKNFGQVIKKYNTIYVDVTEILKEHRFTRGQKAIMCIRLNNGREFWNSASIWFEIGVDREYPEYCRHSTSDLKLRKGCGYGMSIVMLLTDFELSILSDDFNKLKAFDFSLYKGLGWDDVLFDSFLFYRRYENEAAMIENEEDCRKHWDWEWTGIENYYKDL
jgi:hypothetical protein